VPDPQQESKLCKLPQNVPIDWFDPEYFNNLPLVIRARYMDASVAIPELWNDPSQSWRHLNDDDFMEQYGNKILEQYSIPTEAEFDAMVYAMDEEDWDEFDGEGNDADNEGGSEEGDESEGNGGGNDGA
jgi:hypothetical protein